MKILERADAPAHLFDISELDFSENLFAERVTHPWVRLGVLGPGHTDESGIEAELRLNTLLLEPGAFADAFGGLGAVGNDLWGVGQPGVASIGDETKYGECRTDEHDPKQYDTIADAAEATRFRVTFVCPAFALHSPVLHSPSCIRLGLAMSRNRNRGPTGDGELFVCHRFHAILSSEKCRSSGRPPFYAPFLRPFYGPLFTVPQDTYLIAMGQATGEDIRIEN